MNKKKLEAVFAWFRENNVGQHVTFGSMLTYILSVTGLAMNRGIGFLILNILSGLWLIFRLYQLELLPMASKTTASSIMAVMSPTELQEMIRGILPQVSEAKEA